MARLWGLILSPLYECIAWTIPSALCTVILPIGQRILEEGSRDFEIDLKLVVYILLQWNLMNLPSQRIRNWTRSGRSRISRSATAYRHLRYPNAHPNNFRQGSRCPAHACGATGLATSLSGRPGSCSALICRLPIQLMRCHPGLAAVLVSGSEGAQKSGNCRSIQTISVRHRKLTGLTVVLVNESEGVQKNGNCRSTWTI